MVAGSRALAEGAPAFTTRMTNVDWDVINSALALYQTELDQTDHSDKQIETTRYKVFERMDRANRNKSRA